MRITVEDSGEDRYTMKRKLLTCGVIFLSAVFLFSGMMVFRRYREKEQSMAAFQDAAGLVQNETKAQNIQADEEQTAFEKYHAVYEQNQDFVGWLTIPGARIDYPVMQTVDEPNFYLKRAFDKSGSAYGVPYVQETCDLEQSDNVIIYGHHMKDGSMFADLCEYEEKDFYQEHKVIHFDTLSGYGTYEVIAAFKTVAYSEDGFQYHKFTEAASADEFDNYIKMCKKLSMYDIDVTAGYGDKLLTLSTCEYSQTDGRMVVVAKQIER